MTLPSYVIKISRDEDFYVYWSDIVEAPLMWGSRVETEEYLAERPDSDRTDPGERLDRADVRGTSALWPSLIDPIYNWDDPGLIYQQQGVLPRASLKALCERLGEDEQADVSDLLSPFDA